jgi:predicted RNase H-like HicB family nuclease
MTHFLGWASLFKRAKLVSERETTFVMKITFTAVFQKVPEGYIGYVEELPGANTQGDTLEEARENLKEAIELVLEANRELAEENLVGADVIREPMQMAIV